MTIKEKYKEFARLLEFDHYAQAHSFLIRSMILSLLKEFGDNICYRCKRPIENVKELSLDHHHSWRTEKDTTKARKIFWDISQISPSHRSCNSSASKVGNKNGYIGISKSVYKPTGSFHYLAEISVNSESIILGYNKDVKKAAVFYDLGIIKYRNGNGILNFPHLRSFYLENVNKDWNFVNDIKDELFTKI